MFPWITNWLQISRLINGAGAIAGNILKYNGTSKTFVPSFQFSKLHPTPGGSATVTITVTGAVVGDVPVVSVNTVGGTPRTVISAKITASNTLTVVMSGDPSTDHVLNVFVNRP